MVLFCGDPQGSCRRSRCECDKALAEKLSLFENQWNMQNHQKWGQPPFNRQVACSASNAAIVSAQVASAQLENPAFDPEKMGETEKTEMASGSKDGAEKLAAILSTISEANKASGGGGDLVLHIQKGGGGNGGGKITQVVQSAPIYGAISGCCGRAPNVHYYREGQRCCVDGEIVDMNAPCSMDFN
mgnify:CR=1 FL=1